MTQDIFYYESDYISNDYFVYTADAASDISGNSTMQISAGVIKGSIITLISRFTQISTISDIRGVDLHAFSHASLTMIANSVRSNNVRMASTASQTVRASRTVVALSQIYSTASINANSTITVNTINRASLNSAFTMHVGLTQITRYIDPWIISGSNYSDIYFDQANSKFGLSALKFGPRTAGGNVDLGPVYGNNKFIGLNIPANTNELAYTFSSTDGVTWTTSTNNLPIPGYRATGTNYSWGMLKYINNQWIVPVIASTGVLYFYTSTDGITWTALTSSTYLGITDIKYYSGQYIAITNSSTSGSVYQSTNLTTWTLVENYFPSSSTPTVFNALETSTVSTQTLTVVVGKITDTPTGKYTPIINYRKNWPLNSSNWLTVGINSLTNTASMINQSFNAVATNGTIWVFAGTGGNIYTISHSSLYSLAVTSVLANLTKQVSNTTEEILELIYANGKFVGRTSTGKIITSSNGTSWTVTTVSLSIPQTTTPWVDGTIPISIGDFNNSVSYGNNVWTSGTYYFTAANNEWKYVDYVGQLANQQPSVYYTPGSEWSNWKTIDFWLYVEPSSKLSIDNGIFFQSDYSIDQTFSLNFDNNVGTVGHPRIQFYATDGAGNEEIVYGDIVAGQWNHIRIVTNGTTGAIFTNGTRKNTFVPLANLTIINAPMYIGRGFQDTLYSRASYSIDEILLTKELLTDPSASTYTVPSLPWSNGQYVNALFHFDRDIEDDNLPWTVARLSSTARVTALGGKTINAQANLLSSASVTARADRTKNYSAALTATATLTANPGRNRQDISLISSSGTMTVNATRIRDFSINAEIIATEVISCNRTRSTSAMLTAFSSELVLGQKSRILEAHLDANFAMSVQAIVTHVRSATANLTNEFTLVAHGDIINELARLESTAQLHCTVNVGYTAVSVLTSIVNLHATITGVSNYNAVLTSAFTLHAQGDKNYVQPEIVWIIPKEDRTWLIEGETNLYSIRYEDRNYDIRG